MSSCVVPKYFVKIIVEGAHQFWTAWIEGTPQVAFSGLWPSQAIERLIDHLGAEQFETDNVAAFDQGTRDGHLEFMLPLKRRSSIPPFSMN